MLPDNDYYLSQNAGDDVPKENLFVASIYILIATCICWPFCYMMIVFIYRSMQAS